MLMHGRVSQYPDPPLKWLVDLEQRTSNHSREIEPANIANLFTQQTESMLELAGPLNSSGDRHCFGLQVTFGIVISALLLAVLILLVSMPADKSISPVVVLLVLAAGLLILGLWAYIVLLAWRDLHKPPIIPIRFNRRTKCVYIQRWHPQSPKTVVLHWRDLEAVIEQIEHRDTTLSYLTLTHSQSVMPTGTDRHHRIRVSTSAEFRKPPDDLVDLWTYICRFMNRDLGSGPQISFYDPRIGSPFRQIFSFNGLFDISTLRGRLARRRVRQMLRRNVVIALIALVPLTFFYFIEFKDNHEDRSTLNDLQLAVILLAVFGIIAGFLLLLHGVVQYLILRFIHVDLRWPKHLDDESKS